MSEHKMLDQEWVPPAGPEKGLLPITGDEANKEANWDLHREEFERQFEELSKLFNAALEMQKSAMVESQKVGLPKADLPSSVPPTMSLLLSAIRKVVPDLIASDICNVQPMTGPVGKIFSLRLELEQPLPQLSFKYNFEPIVVETPTTRVTLTPIGYDPDQARRLPYN